MVRKEFLPRNAEQSVFETELRNLSILKLLHHPNIIELKGSYAYRGKFNLIFPRAYGGTLDELMKRPRPPELRSNVAILFALSGLCSAVSAVHRFVSSGDNLELIGCHHDLKPSNVLIEGSTFLLADFGLSRFKSTTQTSETPTKTVHAYYTAPEYSAVRSDGERPMVRRSSDVWSLGCIIAEVVTYMMRGPDGVIEFEESRRFKPSRDSSTSFRFHRGGAEHPAVKKWVNTMKQADSEAHKLLGGLVEEILQITASERPSAHVVERKMRFIAFWSLSQQISTLYASIGSKSVRLDADLNLDLERAQFESWKQACPMLENSDDSGGQWAPNNDSQLVQEALGQILEKLQMIDAQTKIHASMFQPLRQFNILLLSHLPSERQESAQLYSQIQTMSHPLTVKLLNQGIAEENAPDPERLRLLSRITSLVKEIRVPGSIFEAPDPINSSRLSGASRKGDFMVQLMHKGKSGDQQKVLVETKIYREGGEFTGTGIELRKRLGLLYELLNRVQAAPKEERFRVLPCVGFTHGESRSQDTYSCGLIYQYPDPTLYSGCTTLQLALKLGISNPDLQPSLEQRFKLAATLATSVLQFHKVSWLQKSINSFNVVVFYPRSRSWLAGLGEPYFLGYSYSRSRDTGTFTEGPEQNNERPAYQHPDYREKGLRFCPEYDYYSLGLLLLEIGLWESFLDCGLVSRSEKSWTEKILEEVVPRLRVTMGTRFQAVVETCLKGDFGEDDPGGESENEDEREDEDEEGKDENEETDNEDKEADNEDEEEDDDHEVEEGKDDEDVDENDDDDDDDGDDDDDDDDDNDDDDDDNDDDDDDNDDDHDDDDEDDDD